MVGEAHPWRQVLQIPPPAKPMNTQDTSCRQTAHAAVVWVLAAFAVVPTDLEMPFNLHDRIADVIKALKVVQTRLVAPPVGFLLKPQRRIDDVGLTVQGFQWNLLGR